MTWGRFPGKGTVPTRALNREGPSRKCILAQIRYGRSSHQLLVAQRKVISMVPLRAVLLLRRAGAEEEMWMYLDNKVRDGNKKKHQKAEEGRRDGIDLLIRKVWIDDWIHGIMDERSHSY